MLAHPTSNNMQRNLSYSEDEFLEGGFIDLLTAQILGFEREEEGCNKKEQRFHTKNMG